MPATSATPAPPLAPPHVDATLFADLHTRLRETLDFQLAEAAEIDPGVPHNNRLLRLRAADGRHAVAKVYYRDSRRRLFREYGAIALLRSRGLTSVPVPYLRSDEHQYAVYSYEPGTTRRAADLAAVELQAIGRFAGDLHRITPDVAAGTNQPDALAVSSAPERVFPPSVAACFSLAEQVAGIRRRLAAFCDFAATPEAYAQVRALCAAIDVRAAVEELITRATAGLSSADLAARLPRSEWRLNVCDFAPHNVISRPPDHPDGPICVVDFEYFGWDDPTSLLSDFVAADSSLGLSPAQIATFLAAYDQACAAAGIPSITRTPRFALACALTHVAWCAIHLSVMTPERVANKRFATPSFDLDAHLAEQIARFKRRLALAPTAFDRLLPQPPATQSHPSAAGRG